VGNLINPPNNCNDDDDDDDRPHDVSKSGLTLRQLYQLRRDADAWAVVYKKRIKDEEMNKKAARKQLVEARADQAKFLDGQIMLKKAQIKEQLDERSAYAEVVLKSVDEWKNEQKLAFVAKMEKNARYRQQFRDDIDRLKSVKIREKQRKVEREQKEVSHLLDCCGGLMVMDGGSRLGAVA